MKVLTVLSPNNIQYQRLNETKLKYAKFLNEVNLRLGDSKIKLYQSMGEQIMLILCPKPKDLTTAGKML